MGCLYFTPCAHCSAKCVNSGLNRFEVFFGGGRGVPLEEETCLDCFRGTFFKVLLLQFFEMQNVALASSKR